ncbi:hypothetical protein Poli38472_004864 [Pythium oligandrum]|uniref:Uncharacterized protein n=1 Tax=Pythium oligandrum TaxID=41045 RepID=A0A8K1CBK1_PYTOL|nr:hypothetical protein Poli38472_004864 [Pythium oligandrum]|eukprot:TMW59795.1 hypothetical protein Poli38472_004864 [Pythium oligandrum]
MADSLSLLLPEEGDNEALEAALAFLDEMHSDEGEVMLEGLDSALQEASVGQSDGLTSESSATATAPKPPRRRRNRRREELEYLRVTVGSLETKLEEITRPKREECVDSLDQVWKRLATHQQEARYKAEAENLKLREQLEEQLRLAKSLERLLKKRGNAEASSERCTDGAKRMRRIVDARPLESASVEEEMKHTLDDMQTEVESVFADARFHQDEVLESKRSVQLKSSNDGGPVIETADIAVFPFDYRETAEASWNIINRRLDGGPTGFQQRVEATEDTTTNVIEGQIGFIGEQSKFRAKIACRRLDEADRVVLLATLLMDPSYLVGTPLEGLYIRTRAWHVIYPIQTTQGPSSVRKMMHRTIPELHVVDGGPSVREFRHKAGILTNFVMKSLDTQMDLNNRQVETMLLSRVASLSLQDEQPPACYHWINKAIAEPR